MNRKKTLTATVFCLLSMPLLAAQAPAHPATAPAAKTAAPSTDLAMTQEEEAAMLVRWQDVEKAQLALQNATLQIQLNHGWGKDVYYDFQSRRFVRRPAPEPPKK